MLVWANRKAIMSEVANVPKGWLDGFALRHKDDCRKFGDSQQSAMLFRVSAVLDAIERGELSWTADDCHVAKAEPTADGYAGETFLQPFQGDKNK